MCCWKREEVMGCSDVVSLFTYIEVDDGVEEPMS